MIARRGALLIVVSALAAIVAALAVAHLMRMRSDVEEMRGVEREAQAHIMLVAACTYVQEASRLGWDDPATPQREEGFGWVDVRDGTLGPKPITDGSDDDRRFPIGHVARCPMRVMQRPPWATAQTVVYNPIRTDLPPADPAWGRPFLTMPDPQPAVANGFPGVVATTNWQAWADGDRAPRPESTGLAWFRARRDGPDTFVLTCGAGATDGWRDWDEIVTAGAEQAFGDRERFADLRRDERLLWYLVAWTGRICSSEYHYLDNILGGPDNYICYPQNSSHYANGPPRGPGHNKNMVGSILWVQRLRDEPTRW